MQNPCEDYFRLLIMMVQLLSNDTVSENIKAFDPRQASSERSLILEALQFYSSTWLKADSSTITEEQMQINGKVSQSCIFYTCTFASVVMLHIQIGR